MEFNFENQVLHWVNRLGFVVRRELAGRFQAAGHRLSAEDWAVLLLLWQEDGQTPTDLAGRTIRDRTTMTRLIDNMVRRNLVERRDDPCDRRRSRICLTETGRSLRQGLIPLAKGLTEAAYAGIPEQDLACTIRTLRKMTDNLLES